MAPTFDRASCDYCTIPAGGLQMRGCRGCAARAAARSQQFHEARKAGKMTPDYRVLLEALGVEHEEVKAAAERETVA